MLYANDVANYYSKNSVSKITVIILMRRKLVYLPSFFYTENML